MNPLLLTAAKPLLGGLFNLVDDLFTSEEERSAAKLKVLELQQSGALAQLGVNLQEAKHRSLFVAGWRPYIGWVCGVAFTWAFALKPLLEFSIVSIAAFQGTRVDLSGLPSLNLEVMLPVLMGMLGLGALRTWEKQKGVASDNINPDTDR